MIINRCAGCGGTLRLFSLTVSERKRLRIGRAWMARCRGCGVEAEVKPEAWRRFVKETKASSSKQRKLF